MKKRHYFLDYYTFSPAPLSSKERRSLQISSPIRLVGVEKSMCENAPPGIRAWRGIMHSIKHQLLLFFPCRSDHVVFVSSNFPPNAILCHSSHPLRPLQIRLCCSRNRNVNTVCGPSRTKLGTHPLNTQLPPSFLHHRFSSLKTPSLPPSALMILVLTTSTGLHTVVATNPAPMLAARCAVQSSCMPVFLISSVLRKSYDASCEAVISTARRLLGHTPRNSERGPSSRVMRIRPSRAFL